MFSLKQLENKLAWVIGGISFVIFVGIVFVFKVPTDIQLHMDRNMYPLPAPAFKSNFLVYWVIWLLSFAVRVKAIAKLLFCGLLAVTVAWKYKVSWRILKDQVHAFAPDPPKWLWAAGFALVWLFSLPAHLDLTQTYYLGQFPANVWHNSTTIVVMPLVVLLYYHSCRYLLVPHVSEIKWLALWGILAYVIKPSILPVIVVTLPLLYLIRHGFNRHFWMAVGYSFGLLCLLIFPLLFVMEGSNGRNEGGGLGIGFLEVWSLYSTNYGLSFVASFLFPVLVLVMYAKDAAKSLLLQVAWVGWAVAFGMFLFLYEKGQALPSGNLGWQLIMATYVLFLASLVVVAKQVLKTGSLDWKAKVALGAYSLHVVSGVLYIGKLMLYGFR